jgi:hypothetical protein
MRARRAPLFNAVWRGEWSFSVIVSPLEFVVEKVADGVQTGGEIGDDEPAR